MKLGGRRFAFSILLIVCFELKLCKCGEENLTSVATDCGGRFSGHQYLITSPNYPNNYSSSLDCVYELIGIDSPNCSRQLFHLQFLEFQLEKSINCSKDYLRIGSDSFYCGNSVGIRRFNPEDGANFLKLLFHSDDKKTTAKGFKILVSTVPCDSRPDASIPSGITTGFDFGTIISHPIYHAEAEFDEGDEDAGRGDQPAGVSSPKKLHKVLTKLPEGLKRPAERLELPIFGKQHFCDQKCGENGEKLGIQGSLSPPKITSYLYLPPKSNLETLEAPTRRNSSSESTSEFLLLPSRRNPSPFAANFRPLEDPQRISNRWLTYGLPDSLSPSKPTGANFDPFANLPPSGANCPGTGSANGWIPSDAESGKENFPNFHPAVGNSEMNFEDWDPSFGVFSSGAAAGTIGNPPPGFANYYPANGPTFGIDESTYDIFGGSNSLRECCGGVVYASENFLLASPGFPSLIRSSSSYECRYTVQRASQSVCQLGISFKFFNFGSDDRFCAYGYLEIDGQRYCGCKTGANVTTSFDNIATKTISVKYAGYPRGKFAGFVLEVSQKSCSTDYLRFRDHFLRHFEQRRNFDEFNIGEEHSSTSRKTRLRRRDVGYYYQAPLTSSENLILGSCRIFKFFNWVKAAKQVWRNSAQCSSTGIIGAQISAGISAPLTTISVIPVFPENSNSLLFGNNPSSQNCEVVNVVEGTISSLYYPSNYSNNSSQCFRFVKAPGYCQLELAMLDFDLENSTFCRKDYVAFAGLKRRYCGNSLAGTRTIFDFTRSSYADMYFVTDSSESGRGFRAGFSQISCSG